MKSDDEARRSRPRIDGSNHDLSWPNAAEAPREATFRRLRSLVLERDAVPDDVLASAKLSFELLSIDDEIAALVYDSAIDDERYVGVRAGGRRIRQLTFAARDLRAGSGSCGGRPATRRPDSATTNR